MEDNINIHVRTVDDVPLYLKSHCSGCSSYLKTIDMIVLELDGDDHDLCMDCVILLRNKLKAHMVNKLLFLSPKDTEDESL